jgi:hypothetical protein
MANTITKLTANGNYYIAGTLDEVTGAGVVTNGLVTYLDAGKTSSYPGYGGTIIDLTGNNCNGYLTGNVTFVANGAASYFNWPTTENDGNYILGSIQNFGPSVQDMTIVFYPDSTGLGGQNPFATLLSMAPASTLYDTSLRIRSFQGTSPWYIPNAANGGGDWDSVAYPQTPGSNTIFYINGTVASNSYVASISGLAISINTNQWQVIGGRKNNTVFNFSYQNQPFYYIGEAGYPTRGWVGRIAAVLLYNRALTAQEQAQNYNYFAARYGLTPISTPQTSSLRINSTTQNTATFLANSIDETTYNPSSSIVPNFVRSSTDFTQTNVGTSTTTKPWNIGVPTWSITPTTATQDPFGGYTAFHINPTDTTTSFHAIYQNNGGLLNLSQLTAGTNITWSFYAKAAELNGVRLDVYDTVTTDDIYFNLTTGANYGFNAGLNGGSIYIGNGWYRFWGTRTLLANASVNFSVGILVGPAGSGSWTADGVSGIYVCAPQLEIGTYPSKYVPTNLTGTVRNFLSRIDANGTSQLTGSYDEYTRGFNIIQNGLIYYMDPSKPESWNGSAVINDITNTYTPGSLNGGFTYNTSGGGSITLDGLSGYANTGILGNTSLFQTTSAFTMSVWCKFTGPARGSGGTSTLFGAFNFQGFGIAWQAATNSYVSQIYGGVRVNTGAEILTLTNNPAHFQLNQWYNYVLSYSSSNLANTNFLYINGSTLAASGTQYATNLPYNTNMNGIYISLGNALQESGGQAGYFPGQIGQALIYNRALSATEINQNFQEMRSQYGV